MRILMILKFINEGVMSSLNVRFMLRKKFHDIIYRDLVLGFLDCELFPYSFKIGFLVAIR